MSAALKRQLARYEIKHVEGLDGDKKLGGAGSYGAVYEVMVEGVPRIAKQLHDILITPDVRPDQKQGIQKRFYHECKLLSELDHPNIVKFVGVHFGSKRRDLDVSLIMERLDTDLDKYLDPKKRPNVPIYIKLSILLDVSFGLLYLHTRKPSPIVHRDLTTSNILLTSDLRAKLADLGVSKLLNLSPNVAAAQTKCPGTLAYMPPEALREVAVYGKALDIFSFGEVCLCTIHQIFAEVYDATDDPDMANALKRGEVQILKRKKWFETMPAEHCLRDLTKSCLLDQPERRPTTQRLTEWMSSLCIQNRKSLTGPAQILNEDAYTSLVATKSSESLEIQLLQEKKANDELSKNYEELQDQLGVARAEAQQYEEDFIEEREARAQAVRAKDDDNDNFRTHVQELSQKLVRQTEEKQTVIAKLESAVGDVQELIRQSDQKDKDHQHALETKGDELRLIADEKAQLMGRVEHFRNLSQRYEHQLERAEKVYQQRHAELEQDPERLKGEAEMCKAEERKRPLESMATQKEDNELSHTKANYAALAMEVQEGRQRLDSTIADSSRLSDEVLAKTQQVRQYKKQTDSYKAQLEETTARLQEALRELQNFQEQNTRLEEDYQNQIEVVKAQLESDKLTAKGDLAIAQRETRNLKLELREWKTQKMSEGQVSESLRIEIGKMEEAEDKIASAEAKCSLLLDKCDYQFKAIEVLQQTLTDNGIRPPKIDVGKISTSMQNVQTASRQPRPQATSHVSQHASQYDQHPGYNQPQQGATQYQPIRAVASSTPNQPFYIRPGQRQYAQREQRMPGQGARQMIGSSAQGGPPPPPPYNQAPSSSQGRSREREYRGGNVTLTGYVPTSRDYGSGTDSEVSQAQPRTYINLKVRPGGAAPSEQHRGQDPIYPYNQQYPPTNQPNEQYPAISQSYQPNQQHPQISEGYQGNQGYAQANNSYPKHQQHLPTSQTYNSPQQGQAGDYVGDRIQRGSQDQGYPHNQQQSPPYDLPKQGQAGDYVGDRIQRGGQDRGYPHNQQQSPPYDLPNQGQAGGDQMRQVLGAGVRSQDLQPHRARVSSQGPSPQGPYGGSIASVPPKVQKVPGNTHPISIPRSGRRAVQELLQSQPSPVNQHAHPDQLAQHSQPVHATRPDQPVPRVKEDTNIQENNLLQGIDDDIHQAAEEVQKEDDENEASLWEVPFDPNLVCPLCMKQFRLGELQKYKKHVGKCQGQ